MKEIDFTDAPRATPTEIFRIYQQLWKDETPMNTGWTPTPAFIARKENLTALQNYLLENGMKESAAAVENVIELIPLEAKRLDWQEQANAEAADWKDNLRSMEDARQ